MSRAVLSLGSNLGDRAANLRAAVAGLGEAVLVVSGVYETAPWRPAQPPAQPADSGAPELDYLNAAVLVAEVDAAPKHWLGVAQSLEQAAGRERNPSDQFAPRTLDVDVVMVWDDDDQPVVSDDPALTLPHPRAHLRAFVLRPWIDIQPYASIPGRGPLTEILRDETVSAQLPGVRPRPDLTLDPE